LVVDIALDRPDLTPRELTLHKTHSRDYLASKSSVYRILKSHNLIASPEFVAISASEKFQNPTTKIHELWQTDLPILLSLVGAGIFS